MERLVIEKLEGAHRNSAEGVTNAPEIVKNLDFDRSGGYKPLGGIDSNWLGDRAWAGILDENDETILYEAGDDVGTEWRPATFFDTADLLAYDEAGTALLTGPQLWYDTELLTFTGSAFANETDLALAPRAGIITPWRQVESAYIGASRFIQTDGTPSYGAGAGTVTVTENAGVAGISGGTDLEFIWVLEAPTDNGLVVFAVGTQAHSVSADIASCSLELSLVHSEGTTARFYYRTTADDAYERFAIAVSDGANEMTALLDDISGTFAPTSDALISFAGGRIEAHNGRMWGPAAERPITTFQPTSQLQRQAGGYMLLSGGAIGDARQYGAVASANMPMRVAGDYVEMVIQRFTATRTVADADVVVELFSIRKTATPSIDMEAYIRWPYQSRISGQTNVPPSVMLRTGDASGASTRCSGSIGLNALQLGLEQGSTLTANAITVKFEIVTLDATNVTMRYTVTVGAATQTGTFVSDSAGANWTDWVAAADTRLSVGDVEYAGVSNWTLGNRELRVTKLEAGNGATVAALGHIDDYSPTSLTWTSTSTNAETWTTQAHDTMVLPYELKDISLPDENPVTNPGLTLTYSSTGSVNRGENMNFLTFSPLASKRITALASTPAGLLVFLENETFLVRGDPATDDLNSQRLSGTLGCDPGIIPARMGSVVLPIYKGEVYAVNLGGGDVDFGGSMVNISRPIWLPDDPFIQVVGEAKRQHVVARTAAGRVYRMDVSEQKWMNDPFDEMADLRWLLPADTDTFYGTRYNVGGYLDVVSDYLVATPLVAWTDLDGGDKNLMKLWRRMEVFTEGVGDGTPTLTYTARGASETVNGIDKGEGRWVFTFKRGIVSPTVGLQLEFLGATEDFVMEPPVVIEYVPRYRQR